MWGPVALGARRAYDDECPGAGSRKVVGEMDFFEFQLRREAGDATSLGATRSFLNGKTLDRGLATYREQRVAGGTVQDGETGPSPAKFTSSVTLISLPSM